MGREQRQFVRGWRARVKVTAFRLLSHKVAAVCKNISGGGLLIEAMGPVPAGSAIRFEIVIPGIKAFAQTHGYAADRYMADTFTASARILRITPVQGGGFNLGVKFEGEYELCLLLDAFVRERSGPLTEVVSGPRVNFLPPAENDEISAAQAVLAAGKALSGEKAAAFEKAFSSYISGGGAGRVCIAVNTAESAFRLALEAVGVKDGDEVILPANAAVSAAEALTDLRARPVLCDIDEHTGNIDPLKILALITPRTKAVIAAHFGGHPCDMEEITAIAAHSGLKVIEDASSCMPAEYKGRRAGTFGDISCFALGSWLAPLADVAILTTNNAKYAEFIRLSAAHGTEAGGNEAVVSGHDYRPSDIACAAALVRLGRADEMRTRRAAVAARYENAFAAHRGALVLGHVRTDRQSGWQAYRIGVEKRGDLAEMLADNDIQTAFLPVPIYKQRFYREKYAYKDADYPAAGKFYERGLLLPIHHAVTEEQADYVCRQVARHLQ